MLYDLTSIKENSLTELPFYNYKEEDSNESLPRQFSNRSLKNNYPHLLTKDLFNELPFNSCSDFEVRKYMDE